jgi:hypothetical protein
VTINRKQIILDGMEMRENKMGVSKKEKEKAKHRHEIQTLVGVTQRDRTRLHYGRK